MQINVRIVGRPRDVDHLEELLRGLQDLYDHGDITWSQNFEIVRVLTVSKDYPRRNEPGNVARYIKLKIKAAE